MTLPTEVNLLLAANNQANYNISRSVRLRSSASGYLNRTFASAGNRQKWTWSSWHKVGDVLLGSILFQEYIDGSNQSQVRFGGSAGQSRFYDLQGAAFICDITWSPVHRDPSAWYHVVFAVDTTQATNTNRVKFYVNGVQITTTASATWPPQNSNLRFNGNTAHFMNQNGAGSGFGDSYRTEINFIDGQQLDPTSFGEFNAVTGVWQPKQYIGTYGTNGFYLPFSNNVTSANLVTYSELIGGTTWTNNANVTASTNSIVAPNGSTTASTLTSTGADGFSYGITGAVASGNTFTFSVWLKAPSTTNINLFMGRNGLSNYEIFPITVTTTWTRFTATFVTSGTTIAYLIGGGNSFTTGEVIHAWGAQINGGSAVQQYLKTTTVAVSAIPAFGQDFSLGDASYNTWTSNNISLTAGATYDSMIDVPTPYDDGGNGRGNYCTMNALFQSSNKATYSNANLKLVSNGLVTAQATQAFKGKFYFECTVDLIAAGTRVGVTGANAYFSTGDIQINGISVGTFATYTTNDVIGVACDSTGLTIAFYKNNVLIYSSAIAGPAPLGRIPIWTADTTGSATFNFGQRPFTYTPPSGFNAVNTQNTADLTIANGANYMAATLYTGNGATQSISNAVNGVSFQPDLVWLKARSAATSHQLFDSVRGVGKQLSSDLTSAEGTNLNALSAFNSNGFSLGTAAGVNTNAATYVAWQWKAGGAAVTNTAGSISSQVSANVSAGFSVVTYTGNGTAGATFGHGLGVAPSMFIVKGLNVNNWPVYHIGNATPARDIFYLNLTNAVAVNTTFWNNVLASSSVITLGNSVATNGSAVNYVAYCWSEVAGFSDFGSYTGNGLADGPFIYTGFRPRYIMIRYATGVANWLVLDTSRDTYNVTNLMLEPNLADAEVTGAAGANNWDILANGFKIRGNGALTNASGGLYVYAVFAENPFKNALAR